MGVSGTLVAVGSIVGAVVGGAADSVGGNEVIVAEMGVAVGVSEVIVGRMRVAGGKAVAVAKRDGAKIAGWGPLQATRKSKIKTTANFFIYLNDKLAGLGSTAAENGR